MMVDAISGLDNSNGANSGTVAESRVAMKNQMNLIDGVGLIVGIMIGSGIFVSPTGVLQFSGSIGLSLIVWILTGFFTTIGAICYAELGTAIPKTGGMYSYILEGFGELPAFLYLWIAIVVIMPSAHAVMALTFANYLLLPLFPNCEVLPDPAVRLIAGVALGFITWMNCHDIKMATKVQDVLTLSKILVLLVIIGTGGYYLTQGHTQHFQKPFQGSLWSAPSIAAAFYQGSWSFSGWYCLNYVVEELRDPNRDLPLSIWISMPLVTVIYFLTSAAYFVLLSPEEMLSSSAVATTFGKRAFGEITWVMSVVVACSIFGSINGSILSVSRLFYSGARECQLPESLALINMDNLLPVPSIIFTGGTAALMLVSSDIISLINYLSFGETLFIMLSIASLLWLRYKRPEMHRPIKVWIGFPILYLAFCLLLVVLPIIARPIELGVAIGVLSAGVPTYYFCLIWSKTSEKCYKSNQTFTKYVQLLTTSIPED